METSSDQLALLEAWASMQRLAWYLAMQALLGFSGKGFGL